MKFLTFTIACLFIFTSCAKKSSDIKPSYVPSLEYAGKSCNQLKDEVININRELRVITGEQDDTASKDSIATGVGLIVFWPALFFLANGEDKERQISELKGRYETVKEVAIQKRCSFIKDLN